MSQILFIELGMGVDLQGRDATKAAVRAVQDAIRRNYLPGIRRLTAGDTSRMLVTVRLAVPPEAGQPDVEAVRRALPYGEVTVEVGPGGMLTSSGLEDGSPICIVNAAVEVGVKD